ncbi:hypothetical protein D9M72_440190 [compost metagenome]
MRRLAAVGAGAAEIIAEQLAVLRVGAIGDDGARALARRQAAQVGQSVLGDDDVDIVPGVVHMRHHRHDAGDLAALGHRLGHKHRQVRIARKVAGAADAVHHVRAAHVRGIDVAVDVALERGVDGDQPQPAQDLGMVADLLRAQQQPRAVAVQVRQEALVDLARQRHRRRRSKRQPARIEQFDGAVLQHLGVHLQVAERRVDQPVQHRVGNGADARLQRLQRRRQLARAHFAQQEIIEVAGDAAGLVIRRQRIGGAVVLGGDDDGGNLFRIDRDIWQADALLWRDQRNRLAVRALDREIDVMQPFQLQRHVHVDLDDHLARQHGEAGRIAYRGAGDDAALLRDRDGLDHRHVHRRDLAGTQLLDGFGQVLVDEHHLAGVDLAAQRGIGLERQAARDHVGLGQHAVDVVAKRGPGHQRDAQRLGCRSPRQRERDFLAVARAGETAHAYGHAVADQRGGCVG